MMEGEGMRRKEGVGMRRGGMRRKEGGYMMEGEGGGRKEWVHDGGGRNEEEGRSGYMRKE